MLLLYILQTPCMHSTSCEWTETTTRLNSRAKRLAGIRISAAYPPIKVLPVALRHQPWGWEWIWIIIVLCSSFYWIYRYFCAMCAVSWYSNPGINHTSIVNRCYCFVGIYCIVFCREVLGLKNLLSLSWLSLLSFFNYLCLNAN